MSKVVTMGAQMTCTFGAAPSALVVASFSPSATHKGIATIMDFAPTANIPPFGVCSSMANPTVASATSAAMGVLTPMPCIPATAAPWAPGAIKVTVKKKPALLDNCKLVCSFGGSISIVSPGQAKVDGK